MIEAEIEDRGKLANIARACTILTKGRTPPNRCGYDFRVSSSGSAIAIGSGPAAHGDAAGRSVNSGSAPPQQQVVN
jgi:hypothetical protein